MLAIESTSREASLCQRLASGNFVAAALDHAFDYARIAGEILSCRESFVDTLPYQAVIDAGLSGEMPFMSESEANYRRIDTTDGPRSIRRELRGPKSLYLRNSTQSDVLVRSRFAVTKNLSHGSWFWRADLKDRLPYTIGCVESLPYRTLGMIRVFLCENTFFPTHSDAFGCEDKAWAGNGTSRWVGISLIPATGGVGTLVWNEQERRVLEVRGHCFLFDDSKYHGVPLTEGARITIRIFGDLDFARVARHLA